MTLTTKHIVSLLIAGAIVIGILIGSAVLTPQTTLGSVQETSEYMATTTAASTIYGSTITGDTLIKRGVGTFGSFVIEGATAGIINFYDATTTDVTQRTKATSTILLATFPASAAANTYTFDVRFSDGLYIDIVGGTMPTSTITYR